MIANLTSLKLDFSNSVTKMLCHYTVVIDARPTLCPRLPVWAEHGYKGFVARRYDPVLSELVDTTAQDHAHLFMQNQAMSELGPNPTLGDGAQARYAKCEVAGS